MLFTTAKNTYQQPYNFLSTHQPLELVAVIFKN